MTPLSLSVEALSLPLFAAVLTLGLGEGGRTFAPLLSGAENWKEPFLPDVTSGLLNLVGLGAVLPAPVLDDVDVKDWVPSSTGDFALNMVRMSIPCSIFFFLTQEQKKCLNLMQVC